MSHTLSTVKGAREGRRDGDISSTVTVASRAETKVEDVANAARPTTRFAQQPGRLGNDLRDNSVANLGLMFGKVLLIG